MTFFDSYYVFCIAGLGAFYMRVHSNKQLLLLSKTSVFWKKTKEPLLWKGQNKKKTAHTPTSMSGLRIIGQ